MPNPLDLLGWIVLALVASRILRHVAPAHAGWPPSLVALWFLTQSWQAPWQAVTSGWSLPWTLLVVFGEITFAVWAIAGLRYSVICSQTGKPATWRDYRAFVSAEVPKFAKRVYRTITNRNLERVK